MDLLAPWKMCLQCLPVFSSDPPLPPPPSPPPSKAVITQPLPNATSEQYSGSTSASAKTAPENYHFQDSEKPSFSDSSLAHDLQHQDLPISDYAKEVGSTAYYAPTNAAQPARNGDEKHTFVEPSDKAEQASDDVEFMSSGLMPLPSPIMPTPMGMGDILGGHAASQHTHHHENSQHTKGHSLFHSHRHDKDPSLHQVSDLTPPNPSPSSGEEGDGSKEGVHQETHHTVSHSMPADMEVSNGAQGHEDDSVDEDPFMMDGPSSAGTLKPSQSEPVDSVASARVRRRDQIKHQLKDIRNQLKQGGHHWKEEGSKHLQGMVSSMNKQGQQLEESGSFFMGLRGQGHAV